MYVINYMGAAVRPAWFTLHWLFGTAAVILAWFNIFKGLDLYVESWPVGGERKVSIEFGVPTYRKACHL